MPRPLAFVLSVSGASAWIKASPLGQSPPMRCVGTPDFRLTALDGGSLPLTTTYDAVVDGTKGDVELKRVDIMLGSSPLQARGAIEGTHGLKGKRVVLNIKSTGVNLAELICIPEREAFGSGSGPTAVTCFPP